jgi:hypothetical protein
MTSNLSLLRVDLLESFKQMLATLAEFSTHLREDVRLPAWVSHTDPEVRSNLDMRLKAVQLFQTLWYEDGQDGRETLTCPGIIGASPETLAAAANCNAAKHTFKDVVQKLKRVARPDAVSLMLEVQGRDDLVNESMRRIGAARLNLKQAYRRIPVLERCPAKIGFTWSQQGRAIQRTSVAEARQLLQHRCESPQVQADLERLANLQDTEILARVRSVCPHLRANLVFETGSDKVERRLMQAPLPILVPLQPGEQLPEFVPISPEPTGNLRLQRSDVRIEEAVFLPSIRAHRYRERYRQWVADKATADREDVDSDDGDDAG